jgi:transglutaminase-like putative cysteine protease
MLIRAGYELVFEVPAPTAMILMLRIHPSREPDIRQEKVKIEPEIEVDTFTDSFGNRCERILAPAGTLRLWADAIVWDSGEPDRVRPDAQQAPVESLPHEVLPYLFNSRYCEVDKLNDIAWELFGDTPGGWSRVKAVCDWVNSKVQFGYVYARATKSALEVFIERTAVCRDFNHLALTLCRCLNIPARYVTGYLGDIGVPASPAPMDFSGWFEVFLDGEWHTYDARHNTPRIGRILMATGRDATDVALTTSFRSTPLKSFTVWTDEVTEESLS